MDCLPGELQSCDLKEDASAACLSVDVSDGRILDCNKAAQELLGYPRQAILQMKVFELYADTPYGLPRAQKFFQDFKACKAVRKIELQVKQNSGYVSWVSLAVVPQKDSAGKIIRYLHVMTDIPDGDPNRIVLQEAPEPVTEPADGRTAELAAANACLKREIKERKRVEKALRENAAVLQTLLNATNHLVLMLDPDGNVITANECACQRYGKTSSEFRGLNIFPLMVPEVADARRKLADRAIRTKKPVSGLEEINGNFFEYIITPILDENGNVTSYSVFSEDVSPLKMAEKVLRENEKRFRMLVEKMNEGLGVLDTDGVLTYVNDRLCTMLGYPCNKVIGHAVSEFIEETNRKIFESQMTGRRTGSRDAYEIQWRHRNNEIIWTIVSPQPLFDEAGDFTGSFAVITDISSLKKAEAALRASENNLKTLAENARDGIVLMDGDGKTVYANIWIEKLSGYSVSEIMHAGLTRLVDPAKRKMHLKELRKRIAGEPLPSRYETEITTKAGRIVPVGITASRTIWHGHPVVLLIIRDITSQKQKELKLKEEHDKLEHLVRERTKELVEANRALLVLARNIDRKREKVREKTSRLLSTKIFPMVERFQKNKSMSAHWAEFDILKAYLNELTPDSKDKPGAVFILSNSELRVATMIKNGFTSLEIARLLRVSPDTVKTHRKNIRKKLNIRNSSINLTTFLRARLK